MKQVSPHSQLPAGTEDPRFGVNGAGLAIAVFLVGFGVLLWAASPSADIRPPQLGDVAFNALVPLRQTLLAQAANSTSIAIAAGALGLAAIWSLALPGRRIDQAISASIVWICVWLALLAQVFVMRDNESAGLALYIFSGAAIFAWTRRLRSPAAKPAGVSRRVELSVLTLIMALAVFGRIDDLKRVPYGVDGDESKWTIEVVSSMVDGGDWVGSEYHRRYLPMSFLMEAPFQWLMGAGLTPARLEVAVFSILATYVFYRLARELFDVPTALIATLLLAVSLPDLSASRAANVESHAKLWSILPMYGLAVSLRTRRLRHFLLTGLATTGAMLTYETLIPIVAAVFTVATGAALMDRGDWRGWLRRLAALATVPAAVSFVTLDYLLGRLQYYQNFRAQVEVHTAGQQLLRGVEGLLRAFQIEPTSDWLYFREGPYINGLLVPLLFLGIICAVAHIRQRGNAVALTWMAWVFIPVPILLHTPLPRVLYPGLPVLYLFIALAIVAIMRAIAQATHRPRMIGVTGALALAGFALLNLTIWFQEVYDPYFEVRRRQAAEIVAKTVQANRLVLMPYVLPGETVETEQDLFNLVVRERHGALEPGQVQAVPYQDLLPALSRIGQTPINTAVLVDATEMEMWDERQQILRAFMKCYAASSFATTYFEVYELNASDFARASCRSAHISVVPPPTNIAGGAATPISLDWMIDPVPAGQSELQCWRSRPGLNWIEAESFQDRAGWVVDMRFVTGFSGSGYLADDPGSQYATDTVDIPTSGTYRLWVRSFRRQDDAFSGFIEIAGRVFPFAEPLPETLNTWRWQPLGDLKLQAGPLRIQLTRPFDQSQASFSALFVDALALSTDPNYDPQRDERWQAVLQLPGPADEQQGGRFEIRLDPGQYRCEITASDGERLIGALGAVGVRSDPVYFQVTR